MSLLSATLGLQDGGTDVTPAFWEVIWGSSDRLPKPPTVLFLPPPPVDLSLLHFFGQNWVYLPFPTPARIVENLPLHACLLPYQGCSNCGLSSIWLSMWDLVPWPGVEPKPHPLGVGSYSHWTTRDFVCVCVLSHVRLSAAPWNVAHQAPLSMEFSRQRYGGR